MIARLLGTRDISCMERKLRELGYAVVPKDEKTLFMYKDNLTTGQLRKAISTVKDTCKNIGSVQVVYGNSTENM